MDELIHKYLDGDLSDEEASVFAQRLARDPELEAELRDYERILALAVEDIGRNPSAAFTDNVMDRVAHAQPLRRTKPAFVRGVMGGTRSWGMRLAWAAGFALVFAFGYMTANQSGDDVLDADIPTALDSASGTGASAAAVSAGSYEPAAFRLVRLVYVPENPDVKAVTVAGTFNAWNPEGTAMRRQGNVWIVQLVLPPESYEYMFVENGERWVTDPLALNTRDDGFGKKNAVLDLTL
jgi:anti-sigma factor RsiW